MFVFLSGCRLQRLVNLITVHCHLFVEIAGRSRSGTSPESHAPYISSQDFECFSDMGKPNFVDFGLIFKAENFFCLRRKRRLARSLIWSSGGFRSRQGARRSRSLSNLLTNVNLSPSPYARVLVPIPSPFPSLIGIGKGFLYRGCGGEGFFCRPSRPSSWTIRSAAPVGCSTHARARDR